MDKLKAVSVRVEKKLSSRSLASALRGANRIEARMQGRRSAASLPRVGRYNPATLQVIQLASGKGQR